MNLELQNNLNKTTSTTDKVTNNSVNYVSEKINSTEVTPGSPLLGNNRDQNINEDDDALSVDSDLVKSIFDLEPRAGEATTPLPPDKTTTPFPYAPGFGPGTVMNPVFVQEGTVGLDGVVTLPNGERVPDVNVYQHKKTLAQGMMDLALFSANANQLRYVLESRSSHPYYYPSIFLIGMSLLLQILVGAGLIWNSRYNVKDQRQICIANKINNFTIIGIFIVTVINVFISAFGVAPSS